MAPLSISYLKFVRFAAPAAGPRLRRVALALLVAGVASSDGARAWTYKVQSGNRDDQARAVAADPAGDIVAAGFLDGKQVVVKLARATGAELWNRVLVGGRAGHVATDASGDVLVAAYGDDVDTPQGEDLIMGVLKLAAATGATLWETEIDAGGGTSFSGRAIPAEIAVDTAGDLIVAVNMRTPMLGVNTFTVIKFSGATGAELWRYQLGAGRVYDLAVVGDDVVAVGRLPGGGDVAGWVVRLTGASGAAVWELGIDDAAVHSVAVDGAGDIAIGLTGPDDFLAGPFAIAKLAGASGATLWSSLAPSPDHSVFQVAFEPGGDVIGAGLVFNPTATPHPFVTKRAGGDGSALFLTSLAPATVSRSFNYEEGNSTPGALFLALGPGGVSFITSNVHDPLFLKDLRVWRISTAGAIAWTTLINGAPAIVSDGPADLLVAAGDPIIAASLGGGKNRDFAVIELDGADSGCRGQGCVLALNIGGIKIGEKFQKKWLWGITATGNPLTVPPARTADDPTTAGAIVTLSNPATRERAVFTLPAGANWTALGSRKAPGTRGYLYHDKEGRSGPCTTFKMVPGKRLTLQCKVNGAVAPFTLDETAQGALDVHIQIGTVKYCLSTAGGEVIDDRATLPGGKRGLFKVKNAPPPMSCD